MITPSTFYPVTVFVTFAINVEGKPCARVVFNDRGGRQLAQPIFVYPDGTGTIVLENMGLATTTLVALAGEKAT